MDNEQKKINQIRAEVNKPQGTLLTWDYVANGATVPRNYNLTTNAAIPQSSPLPITYVTGQGLSSESLEQVRNVVREELQREQSRDRSGSVHICIDGQWYRGDLYPIEEGEAND